MWVGGGEIEVQNILTVGKSHDVLYQVGMVQNVIFFKKMQQMTMKSAEFRLHWQ